VSSTHSNTPSTLASVNPRRNKYYTEIFQLKVV